MDAILVVLASFVAFLAGLGGGYALLEKRLNQQEQNNQMRLRQQRQALEQLHQERLQSRVQALQAQHATQVQQLKVQLTTDQLAKTFGSQGAGTGMNVKTLGGDRPWSSSSFFPLSDSQSQSQSLSALQGGHPASFQSFPAPSSLPLFQGGLVPLSQLDQPSRDPDPMVRSHLAQVLNQVAVTQPTTVALPLIPYLGKLSQDPVPEIRHQAIVALGQIQSNKVLPFLRRGLKDADQTVVRAASQVLDRFRATPSASTATSGKPPGQSSGKYPGKSSLRSKGRPARKS